MANVKKCVNTLIVSVLMGVVSCFGGSVFAVADDPSARVAALSKVDVKEMIIYPAKNAKAPKAFITVFTDMDCTYCRKFHAEIAKANDLGIEIRYMAYPRHGTGSETYDKMVTVWCSANPKERKDLMERAMQGEKITLKTCDHKVDDHRSLGRQLGISGTPTIVFEDGTVWSGYMPANQLAKEAIKHKSGDGKDARSSR